MAGFYARLALVFFAGAVIASAVTWDLWPVICVVAALVFLIKVTMNLSSKPTDVHKAPKVPVRGRPRDWENT